MPTVITYGDIGPQRLRQKVLGNWIESAPSSGRYSKRIFVSDTTVRRVRPKDGFLNGTARTSRTELVNNGGVNYSYNSGLVEGINRSMIDNFPQSYSRVDSSGKPVSVSLPSVSREILYNRIRSQIRGDATNLAQNLVEYRQTAQLFGDLAKIVSSRGRSLLRRNPSIRRYYFDRTDLSKSAAGAWLQFQYGVRPLMQDMHSAYSELRNSVLTKPIFIEGASQLRDSVQNVAFRLPSSTVLTGKAVSELTLETRLRTRWRAYLNQGVILTELAAHGFTNPAAVAWELLPFSFIVDWWVNIGDVLSSLDNLLLIDSLYVIDSSSTRRSELVQVTPGGGFTSSGAYFYHTRTDSRTAPFKISPIATFSFKPSLSLQHVLNGTALLRQLVPRKT